MENEVFKVDNGEYRDFRDFVVEGMADRIKSVVYFPNLEVLMCSNRFRMIVWNFLTGKCLKVVVLNEALSESHGAETESMIKWDEESVLFGNRDGDIFSFSVRTYELLSTFNVGNVNFLLRSILKISNDEFIVIGNRKLMSPDLGGRGALMCDYSKKTWRELLDKESERIETDYESIILPSITLEKCIFINCRKKTAELELSHERVVILSIDEGKILRSILPGESSRYIYHINNFMNSKNEEILMIVGNTETTFHNVTKDQVEFSLRACCGTNYASVSVGNYIFVSEFRKKNLSLLDENYKNMNTDDGKEKIFNPFYDKGSGNFRLFSPVLAKGSNWVLLSSSNSCVSLNRELRVFKFVSNTLKFGEDSLELVDLKERIDYMIQEAEEYLGGEKTSFVKLVFKRFQIMLPKTFLCDL